MNKKTFFLTGGTGLLGSFLLKTLIENGHKVFCLAREKNGQSAKERVKEVINFWIGKKIDKICNNNLVVLNGDIAEDNLGLDNNTKEILKDEVEQIFHCAALTEFKAPLETLRKVNVDGTEKILELGLHLSKEGKLKRINYMSSIYICGDYKGIFTENTFYVGQRFATPYEQSKFEAEKLVYEYRKKGLWVDIFRVPAIVGESKTGKISSFKQSFYQALQILNSEIFGCLPCKNSYLNVVYIDDLCKNIYIIARKSRKRNLCYNVFGPQQLSIEKILTLTSNFLNVKRPKYITYEEFVRNNPSFIQNNLLKHNFFFLARKVKFDSLITNEYFKKYRLSFSNLDENKLIKLLQYAVDSGFLKTKTK